MFYPCLTVWNQWQSTKLSQSLKINEVSWQKKKNKDKKFYNKTLKSLQLFQRNLPWSTKSIFTLTNLETNRFARCPSKDMIFTLIWADHYASFNKQNLIVIQYRSSFSIILLCHILPQSTKAHPHTPSSRETPVIVM